MRWLGAFLESYYGLLCNPNTGLRQSAAEKRRGGGFGSLLAGGSGPSSPDSAERVRMLQLQLSSWLLGVLVLAVGILLPLGLAASRNKVLQQAWEKATGKTV